MSPKSQIVFEAKALSRTSTISVRALEKAMLDVEVRNAAIVKSQANVTVQLRQLESARARLVAPIDDPGAGILDAACCLDVRSPVSGRVLQVLNTSEQAVQIGTPLVEIGDPRSLEIVVELLSSDAVKVRKGALAVIDGWGGGQNLQARVSRIESSGFTKVSALGIEEQRVRVILDLAQPDGAAHRLGHEIRVFIRIDQWGAADAVRVPIGALFRSGRSWAVFKTVNGRAGEVLLKIGHRNADHAEVLSGLIAGDRVVLHPGDQVQVGARVTERSIEAVGNQSSGMAPSPDGSDQGRGPSSGSSTPDELGFRAKHSRESRCPSATWISCSRPDRWS